MEKEESSEGTTGEKRNKEDKKRKICRSEEESTEKVEKWQMNRHEHMQGAKTVTHQQK